MATKNLARTALAKGRATSYKVRWREIERARRATERVFLQRVALDPEHADADEELVREKLSKRAYQSENLAPLWRYLSSRVGKSWKKVYSEIRRRFDPRSLASFHLIVQHMLRDIAPSELAWRVDFFPRYFVDDQGRLQHREVLLPRTPKPPPRELFMPEQQRELCIFLNGRNVREVGAHLFWLEPTDSACTATWNGGERHGAVVYERQYYDPWWVSGRSIRVRSAWRQSNRLSFEEEAYLRSLPEWVRNGVLTLTDV